MVSKSYRAAWATKGKATMTALYKSGSATAIEKKNYLLTSRYSPFHSSQQGTAEQAGIPCLKFLPGIHYRYSGERGVAK